MTREEATRWLEDIHRRFNPTGENLENEGGDVHLQALDMAIEALSAVCDDCIWHVCNYNKVDWDGEDGYISKRDALAEFRDGRDVYDIMESIEELPSVEPKTGWIPVSERLPEDSGNYLITVADLRLGHIGENTVTMADFYAKAKKWNSIVDVYAWMPLPEPYREDGEE